MDDLKKVFSMEGLSKSPAVFDYEKLRWFNSEYIKNMSVEAYNEKAMPILESLCPEYINLEKLGALLHTRIATFSDIEESIQFVVNRLPMGSELYTNKKNKTTPEICKAILEEALPVLESIDDWCNDVLFEELKAFAENTERKAGAVMWAIRIAVARLGVTPGGATELMEVFGKTESLDRIKLAIEEL